MRIRVHVPATTANLGPGLDCLAMALDLWNTVEVKQSGGQDSIEWREPQGTRRIDPAPPGSFRLPAPRANLVLMAIDARFKQAGRSRPPLHLTLMQGIPIARGLGSSAAAIVGGLLAADELIGTRLTTDERLSIATELEGHPDNVSAALLGGITLSAEEQGRIVARRIAPPRGWCAALFIPVARLSTRRARSVLPVRVPRGDAIYNLGRTALLVYAFAKADASALDPGTRDRLHQPYRQPLVRGMEELFEAARAAGAAGVALSGAGPALVAFCSDEKQGRLVTAALTKSAAELKLRGAARLVRLSARGAFVD